MADLVNRRLFPTPYWTLSFGGIPEAAVLLTITLIFLTIAPLYLLGVVLESRKKPS
jgi:hypothetical protein